MPESAVDLASFQQLLVFPDRRDLAPLEHEDRVRIHQGGQPVGYDDHRPPLGDPADVFVDDRLAVRIESAGGFVKDQDLGVENEGSRDRESLALAARQVRRPLVDVRLVTAGKPVDEFLGAGEPSHPDQLIEGRMGLCGGDVLADRAAEQKVLLQHDAEAAPEVAHVVFAHVDPVDLDEALVVGVQPLEEARDRRFAGPASSDDAERVPDWDVKAEVVERGRRRALVFEANLDELHVAGQGRANPSIGAASPPSAD